jgi:rhamnosyltransferase
LSNFDTYVRDYDLFITTDSQEKADAIAPMIAGRDNVKEVLLVDNVGRDVLPWQLMHDRLDTYEIAGHFHTKKSKDNEWIVGESWRQVIIESLVKPAKFIFDQFESHDDLGVFIPDIPSFFNYYFGPKSFSEAELWDEMSNLWLKAFPNETEQTMRLQEKGTYTMAYGTMLWYRPVALKDLLDTDFKDEIPAEPLPYNSILHAFERLLVYVAWANGYDFRISQTKRLNGFISNASANRMQDETLALASVGELPVYAGQITWEYLGARRALKYLGKWTLDKLRGKK